jgi:Ni/Co efflux regulator RcnB
MNRIRILLLAGLIAAAPVATTSARALEIQDRETRSSSAPARERMDSLRQDRAREESRDGRRVSASEVARSVSRGRDGRMLGINERNMGGRPGYVVRWEYPGGRVADIRVDGRSGAVIGEN